MSESGTSAQWLPGRRIDAYVLLREIARGGMGEVWLALDRGVQFERLVVIKRVLRASDDDPQHISLFLDEARIASQLQHPHVVQVFTMGEVDGAPYLVMEYLPGQTLGRVVRAYGKTGAAFPVELAARIICDAAKGLGYAHRRKGLDGKPLRIVHRDVSPQNILVTYEGLVKVLDFGIAVAEGRMSRTQTGVVRGKIAYMAPEQALGQPLTAQADVFALGVILWELTTGKRLHGEADDLAVLRRLAMDTAELPNIRSHTVIDEGLAVIISTALNRAPDKRYADGVGLADALDGWLALNPAPRSLSDAMEAAFGEEIKGLPELQRAVTVTPSVGVEREMPAASKTTPGTPFSVQIDVAPIVQGARRRRLVAGAAAAAVAGAVLTFLLWPSPRAVVIERTDAGAAVAAAQPEVDSGASEPIDSGLVAAVDLSRTKMTLFERLASVRAGDPGTQAPYDELKKKVDGAQSLEVIASLERELTELAAAAERRKKKPPEAVVVAKQGTLSLDTEPWTRVFLGKRSLGDTPLVEQSVPSGALRLHLVNEAEGVDTYVDVKVAPGALTTKQYRLK